MTQDVPDFGFKGLVRKCKPGALRNWLAPQGLAALATKDNLEKHSIPNAQILYEASKQIKSLKRRAARLEKTKIIFFCPHHNRKLLTPITREEIGREMYRRYDLIFNPEEIKIKESETIGTLGSHRVSANFFQKTIEMIVTVEPEKIIDETKDDQI